MSVGDVFIRFVPLPYSVRAVTLPNDDGTFDVYINDNLPDELRRKALRHELEHIKKDHFYDCNPVWINEQEAG